MAEIVVLDSRVLNPGDTYQAFFEALGGFNLCPRTAPEEVLERIGRAAYVLV
ncbi:MAG: hypothetical protein LBP22_00300 [Deltaproteobacteria bacterium]|nr:hypothetical protein [Deltaproteobacteria bacterium]